MAFQQRDMSGALFRNEEKTEETHSDYKGSAKINDVEYWVNGWINTAKRTGKKYMSIRFTLKETTPRSPVPGPNEDFDNDMPF